MLDIKFIRENPEKVKKGAKDKGVDIKLQDILKTDKSFRKFSAEEQELREERNTLTHGLKGKPTPAQVLRGKELKEKLQTAEIHKNMFEKNLNMQLLEIPNLPKEDVPLEDEEIKKVGEIQKFNFTPKDHLDIGEALDIIDVKRASKVSGSRFGYLKNEGVLLEFALIQLALEVLIKEGFIPVIPPVIIKPEVALGLGYWQGGGNGDYYLIFDPSCRSCGLDLGFQAIVKEGLRDKLVKLLKEKKLNDQKITELEERNEIMTQYLNFICIRCGAPLNPDPYQSNLLWLVGTAEHSLVPMHKDEILNAKDLPKRYVGFSSAFRREAGTYGKDTKGILRVHQFDKVEMISIVSAGEEDKEHEFLLSLEEKLFQLLEIPYHVVKINAMDLGFPISKKYDIEAWLPSENKYREMTSVSTTGDFQSRRLNIKYQDGNEKKYVNILNGTAFAIGRTIIAILENYQNQDGSVNIPKVLQKYIGKNVIK